LTCKIEEGNVVHELRDAVELFTISSF